MRRRILASRPILAAPRTSMCGSEGLESANGAGLVPWIRTCFQAADIRDSENRGLLLGGNARGQCVGEWDRRALASFRVKNCISDSGFCVRCVTFGDLIPRVRPAPLFTGVGMTGDGNWNSRLLFDVCIVHWLSPVQLRRED